MENTVVFGDCRESMGNMILDGVQVQMCVTSPPYFGLRDYGVDGQLGMEPTPQEYVDNLVSTFRLVRDLLADDGTLWLNLGDSYNAHPGQRKVTDKAGAKQKTVRGSTGAPSRYVADLKPKDLIGIPWRVAFALQADGWYLRQDIIWHKPNPMPESVTDRCTKAHEYIFLLSKQSKYYFDSAAMQEPAVKGYAGSKFNFGKTGEHQLGRSSTKPRVNEVNRKELRTDTESRHRSSIDGGQSLQANPNGMRNRRSVWTVTTKPYKGAHFATFPKDLIEPCILAGSRPGDIVFDPFMGSGTTAQVALEHGRKYLGCELNREYKELQDKRIASVLPKEEAA